MEHLRALNFRVTEENAAVGNVIEWYPMRYHLLPTLLLALSSTAAFALPGEAEAVIRHCGQPNAENRSISQVTNRDQRDLIYNDLTLHFEPLGGGWSFTTAWHKHLPMTRPTLEQRLPCFRAAMNEVAAAPLAPIDPTVARQTVLQPIDSGTFGIPHFWLILLLAAAVLLFILIPTARRRNNRADGVERSFRRPMVLQKRIRKPKLTNLGD